MEALEKFIQSLKQQREFAAKYDSQYCQGYHQGLQHAVELGEVYLKAEQDKTALQATVDRLEAQLEKVG